MDDSDWVPFSKRQDWQDVQCLDQVEGEVPVVTILYDSRYKQVMAMFQAVIRKGEKSNRVLQLTEELIDLQSAFYTAWDYRFQCLVALDRVGDGDWPLTDKILADNPKNYQLWQHRRRCAQATGLKQAERELQFTVEALEHDAKNYHAWSHRQFVVKSQQAWRDELVFIDSMLAADVYNNSAWNQRFWVLSNMLDSGLMTGEDVWRQELEYVRMKLLLAVNNASAWSYLSGLLRRMPATLQTETRVFTLCEEVLKLNKTCIGALALLAEYYGAYAAQTAHQGAVAACTASCQQARAMCQALAVLDTIRRRYWLFQANHFHCAS